MPIDFGIFHSKTNPEFQVDQLHAALSSGLKLLYQSPKDSGAGRHNIVNESGSETPSNATIDTLNELSRTPFHASKLNRRDKNEMRCEY